MHKRIHLIIWLSSIGFLSGCSWVAVKSENNDSSLAQVESLLTQYEQTVSDQAKDIAVLSAGQKQAAESVIQLQSQMTNLTALVEKALQARPLITQPVSEDVPPVSKFDQQEIASGKFLVGRVEWLWLDSASVYMKARIDTGARTSSIHAENIQEYERDGKKWVRFSIRVKDEDIELAAPLVKYTGVKQASIDEPEKRPLIKLNVRLGDLDDVAEFTLSDRGNMLYPVLIGRNFIRDVAIVDVSKKFVYKRQLAEVANE